MLNEAMQSKVKSVKFNGSYNSLKRSVIEGAMVDNNLIILM